MKSCIHHPSRSRNQGFSLIEALIAVVVLATGLLALTALQGAVIRSSADAKARSLLAAHSESVLEQIRHDGVNAIPVGTTTVVVPGIGNVTQTIAATTYVATGGVFSAGTYDPLKPFYQDVTITLVWTDATGSSRRLSMRSSMSPLALASTDVLVDRKPPSDSGQRPIVRRETPVTEGMIPVALGTGQDTAATNPKPLLLGGETGTYVSDTRFDILTYNGIDNRGMTGIVRFDKKIETAVIGCTCLRNAAGFNDNQTGTFRDFLATKAFRPTWWDGNEYTEPKPAAYNVSSSPDSTSSQSVLCDVCCRDHQDPDGTTAPESFSPWLAGAAHDHFNADLGTGGPTYQEACRVIRTNGVFRVAADPKVQDIALVATQFSPPQDTSGSLLGGVSNNNSAVSPRLQEPVEVPYVNYVYNYVRQVFSDSIALSDPYAIDPKVIQQDKGLNIPPYVPILPENDIRWLHARALVTDYLEPKAIERIKKAKASTTSTACTSIADQGLAQCVLPYSPIATVNTTELARWSPRAKAGTDTLPTYLSSLGLSENYYNYATSKMVGYNSGLALVSPISATDGNVISKDEQLFVQLSASAPSAPVWLYVPSPSPSSARYFGNPLNPMRGYAAARAPIGFNLAWNFSTGNPASPVTDANKGNDPSAAVGNSGLCDPNDAGNTSNPYRCQAYASTNVVVSLAGYNRIEVDNNANNPCGSGQVSKPSCVVYTFTSATVNTTPATLIPLSSYSVPLANIGKLNEVGTFTIPGITPAGGSQLTVNFTRSQPPTTWQCSGTTPVWSLPCQ